MNIEDVPIWMKRQIKRKMDRNAERKNGDLIMTNGNSAEKDHEGRSNLPGNIVLFPGALRLKIQYNE